MTTETQKIALITGASGMDASYLIEFLLSKGYIVHGIIRRSSSINTQRLDHLYEDPHVQDVNLFLQLSDFLEEIKFGVQHEHTFECPICGLSEGRSLQQQFNFIEFIPTKSNTSTEIRNITRGNIFMGI